MVNKDKKTESFTDVATDYFGPLGYIGIALLVIVGLLLLPTLPITGPTALILFLVLRSR